MPGRKQFSALGDGTYKVRLAPWERSLLSDLPVQLTELLQTDDESLRRVFPIAYHSPVDAERDAEYQRFMREELLASRLASAELLQSSAEKTVLTESELMAWMNAMNVIRLVLGTQLDVGEEFDTFYDDDPRAPVFAVYGWLGLLVERAVDALQGTVANNAG